METVDFIFVINQSSEIFMFDETSNSIFIVGLFILSESDANESYVGTERRQQIDVKNVHHARRTACSGIREKAFRLLIDCSCFNSTMLVIDAFSFLSNLFQKAFNVSGIH